MTSASSSSSIYHPFRFQKSTLAGGGSLTKEEEEHEMRRRRSLIHSTTASWVGGGALVIEYHRFRCHKSALTGGGTLTKEEEEHERTTRGGGENLTTRGGEPEPPVLQATHVSSIHPNFSFLFCNPTYPFSICQTSTNKMTITLQKEKSKSRENV